MNDIIRITDLEIYANHGVYPEENILGQKFLVSAELYTDFFESAQNDDIEKSVDYGCVCNKIYELMKKNTFKLIETAARRTAEMILESFELVKGVKVEIKKPWAPVGLPIKTASVETTLKWHDAYVAFGSNMGDKEKYINNAISSLNNEKGCRVQKVSEFFTTKPYGGVEQDDFLNGVLRLRTYLDPHELLKVLNRIESEADRKREIHWGPRTLDLDIILYDDLVIDTEDLHIPHIDLHNRTFVLEPLCQIAPFIRHPVLNKTAEQLLKALKTVS